MPTKKRERMISVPKITYLNYVSSITVRFANRSRIGGRTNHLEGDCGPPITKTRAKFVRKPIGAGSGVV